MTVVAEQPRPNREAEAIAYAKRGWKVFPVWWIEDGRCACGVSGCGNSGKHPVARKGGALKGFHDATSDIENVRKWWHRWPDANIGLATGETRIGTRETFRHQLCKVVPKPRLRLSQTTCDLVRSQDSGRRNVFRAAARHLIPIPTTSRAPCARYGGVRRPVVLPQARPTHAVWRPCRCRNRVGTSQEA